jgi:hypothetical protein
MLLVQIKLNTKAVQRAQALLDMPIQTEDEIKASFGENAIDYRDIELSLSLILIAKIEKEKEPVK